MDAGIDRADVDRAAGLEQDGLARVGQPGHQREDLGLEQRLAAGDLDQVVAEVERPRDDLVERQGLPWVKACGVSQ